MTGMTDLSGKVGVVTGGASGIGKGIAKRMLAAGMKVVIADVEDGRLQEVASELGVLGVQTDVRHHAALERLAERTLDAHGAVHVLCNNAGIGPMATIADLTLADWRWMIDVNLWGVIHGVHVFLPILRANADGGHIVNTSSMGGLRSSPTLGAYSVTKFGVVALTETLAEELAAEGSKVGASVLCPGPVRSDLGRSSRNRPEELGEGHLKDVQLEDAAHFRETVIPYVEPDDAGETVIQGIRRGDLYILTHPEMMGFVSERHGRIENAARSALAAKSPG